LDFELIISDNGSTDETEEICRAHAARDPRIRYLRHDTNRGATWNFRHVLDEARAPLFMWRAHNDTTERTFLSAAVMELGRNPDIACVQGGCKFDLQGHTVFSLTRREHIARDGYGHFFLAREPFGKCMYMYGLFRTEALRRANWVALETTAGWWWNDAIFLASILSHGGFRRIAAPAMRYRLKFGTEAKAVVSEAPRGKLRKLLAYHPMSYFSRCIAAAPASVRWRLRALVPLKIAKSNLEAWVLFVYQHLALRWVRAAVTREGADR
jgi:glycosyltransferase involved in cell wall biosynthesis